MQAVTPIQAIAVEPLTSEAFASFGDVVAPQGQALTINQGRCEKYSHVTSVDTDDEGRVSIHLYKTSAIRQPFTLDLLERHPLGSQTFMPLEQQRFLVVVAESDSQNPSQPDWDSIRCFMADGHQGVTYRTGVWHHPLLSLDSGSDFLVVDRAGPGKNCDEVPMPSDMDYTVEVNGL